MYTDGGRIEHLLSTKRHTATDLARELGVSRSMLYAVIRGEKRLGRDRLDCLKALESLGELVHEQATHGVHYLEPPVAVRENRAEVTSALLAEVDALKTELRQAHETIANLSVALARRDGGRAGPPAPASPAAGASYGSGQRKAAKAG